MADTPATADDTLYEFGPTETSEGHHVNVQQAEETFNELSRALSRKSTHKSTRSESSGDIEKGSNDGEAPFDLREYLTSSNDANQGAGIKHKHVGVTWDSLKVDVIGGADQKVSNTLLNVPSGKTYTDVRP